MATPTEIRVRRASRRLEIDFAGGLRFSYPAEYLRVESPSAEVQGHSAKDKILVAGKEAVGITTVDPIGHYAIRIHFDDGHDTGIFTWDYLLTLGQEQTQRWADYLAALAAAGQSRAAKPAGPKRR